MKKDIYKKCFNYPPFFFYIKQKPIKIIQGDRVHLFTDNTKKCMIRLFTRNLKGKIPNSQINDIIETVIYNINMFYDGAFLSLGNIIILSLHNIEIDSNDLNQDFYKKVVETISHETIHYVLKLNEGLKACIEFDNICRNINVITWG